MPGTDLPEQMVLVVVVDGLRVQDTGKMPYLTSLSETGAQYVNARTISPSLTRPAAASLTTGHHPVDVGIAGNHIWDSGAFINTGDPDQLETLRGSRHGRILNPPTLAEHLQGAGMTAGAIGTGSNGCSLLLNPEAASGRGVVIGTRPHESSSVFVAPPALRDGVAAHSRESNESRLQWAVRLVRDFVVPQCAPELLFVWIGELDYVQHDHGVDTEAGDQALAVIDTAIEELVTNLRGRLQQVDVVVTADHGFSDATGTVFAENIDSQLPQKLIQHTRLAYNNGALLVYEDDAMVSRDRKELVAWILDQDWSGAVFSDVEVSGSLPLTLLSSSAVAPGRLLAYVSLTWTNSLGERKTFHCSDSDEMYAGGHGSTSDADMAVPLILNGPGFRSGVTMDVPVDILDVAPTLLHLLGVTPLTELPGRVLTEALPEGAQSSTSTSVESLESMHTVDDVTVAQLEVVAGRRYVRSMERLKSVGDLRRALASPNFDQ